MHRVIFIVFGLLMFAYCKREGDDVHKEASLLRSRHILEVAFPDDNKRAQFLGLPFGPDAIKKAMMDFFGCNSEIIDSFFKSDGTIDREKLKSFFFERRLLVESFVKRFIEIMPEIGEDDRAKSFARDFPKICEFREFLIKNKNSLDSSLTAPQLMEKFNDALIECFSSLKASDVLKKLREKTGLNKNGSTEKFEKLHLEFVEYDEGTIGILLKDFGLNDDFVDSKSYSGQTTAITLTCVLAMLGKLINKITPGSKEINGKTYTKTQLAGLLRSRAHKIYDIDNLRKNKIPEKVDENGDIQPERYMTVYEIMDTLMSEKVD